MIVHIQHFPGGTGKNYDNISEHLVPRTIFKQGTSRREDKSVITWAKLFIWYSLMLVIASDQQHNRCCLLCYSCYLRLASSTNCPSSFSRMKLHVTFSRGYPDSTGQFDGMLGMLQRREAQLAITSLTMSPQRLAVVDFTGPTWKFRSVSISGLSNT
jgi:hypothetical protein